MPDNRFYFPHDLHARNDFKVQAMIQDFGAAGVGIYWCLVEMLHEQDNNLLPLKKVIYQAIAKQLNTEARQIENFIGKCISDYELLKEQDGCFFSQRVMDNMQRRKEISEKRRESGKAGAFAKHLLANAKQKPASAKQLSGKIKQRKGKEIKEKNTYRENISLLPEEHEKLTSQYGEEKINACYDFLSSYKIEKNYSTESDYLTILRWVVDAVDKRIQDGTHSSVITHDPVPVGPAKTKEEYNRKMLKAL